MENWKIDVAVLLIFFCRDKQFERVFEQVKKARPRILFLYQDGPRANKPSDIEGINKCRQIAEDIDWDCTVYKLYQTENVGCDPSEYIAQKWAFSIVDKCIVLEDDDVPSQSFFRFCKELLDYYENDERIHMICGMNNNDITEYIDDSYFFSKRGSIWGWASWRRVIDTWDGDYSILDSEAGLSLLRNSCEDEKDYQNILKTSRTHKATGRAHYESINGLSRRLYNRINIVPKYNMISNIGVGEETTHGLNDIRKYPKKVQKLLYKKTYEIDFPLKHPKYIVQDKKFDASFRNTFIDKLAIKFESTIKRIIYR